MNSFNVLAVIPARGGSKGLRNKNIRDLCGYPLIKYSIDCAKKSMLITDFVVSTDSINISEISKSLGAHVPFIRPNELSSDNALSLPVMQHATKYMETSLDKIYDAILMLQPTTPLRLSIDVDTAITLMLKGNYDSVISVVDVDGYHPYRMKKIQNNLLVNFVDQGFEDMRPRQELPKLYIRNGAVYLTKRNILMEQNSFVGEKCAPLVMDKERSINIDTIADFKLAEFYLENQK